MPIFLKKVPLDKLLHFLVGGVIAGVVYALFLNQWLALIATVVAGVTKEIYDYFHPDQHTVEWLDVVATVVGAAPVLLAVGIQYVMWE
ncbi:hypothetical protein [Collimonas antrihumi]|uniref:hypothetical protein n=1 Tax=Collimonas antrihumi TaxID=1940615 RepID=UPI001B8C2F8B|nr:hypothetical protein [Collimonas antrihumi]